MKSLMFFIICILINTFSIENNLAQTGVALPFLLESPDARYSGMGNTGTAVANDINATFLNPGGLGLLRNTIIPKNKFLKIADNNILPYFEASYSFSQLPMYSNNNKSFGGIAAGVYIDALEGFLAFDYCYDGLGEMSRTNERGDILGKYQPDEFYLGLAYGTLLNENCGIGIKIKYLISSMVKSQFISRNDISDEALVFDIGILWNFNLSTDSSSIWGNRSFSAGVSLQNLGSNISYYKEDEPIPTTLRLGVAFKPNTNSSKHKFIFAVDGIKLLVKRDSSKIDPFPKKLISSWETPFNFSLGIGAEYWYMKYFALRAGYYSEPFDLGNRQFLTFGSSIRIFIVQADISYYSSFNDTKYLTNMLKLTFRIGG